MASISPRKDKNGTTISFQIKVSRGRDPLTRKQLTPFTTTYTPPAGWSTKAIERDLMRFVGEFEVACKRGEIKTKEEIKAEAQAAQAAAEAARMDELRKPTFNQYLERYITAISIDRGIGTVLNYKATLERAGKVFGEVKMADITHHTLQDYITDLQVNAVSSRGKHYTVDTCRWHYLTLHAYFQHALEADIVTVNPMGRVKPPRQSKDKASNTDKGKAYSEAEINDILEHASKEPLKVYCLITLALDSWCRRGELLALKWSDVDMNTGLVRIERNVQYNYKNGIYITTPKSGEGREIYVSKPTLALLGRWRKEQAELFLKLGWQSDFIFTQDTKPEPMNPNTLTDRIRRFGKRIGYDGLHPHSFRHSGITLALLHGEDITSVSRRAGHSTVSITLDIYSHSSEEAQKRIASTLGSVIGNIV